MYKKLHDDRPERVSLWWIFNPSAPITEEELEVFIESTSHLLDEKLTELERSEA
jgi:hypothetical protein